MGKQREQGIEGFRAAPRTPAGDTRLAAMLRHDAGLYGGRSTAEAERLRGELLAAFEDRALPAAAVDAIREELRTSLSPIVLAGAARALRGSKALNGEMLTLLKTASERLASRDEYVRFGAEGQELGRTSPALTARQEIAATIAVPSAAQPHACCASASAAGSEDALAPPITLCAHALAGVTIDDQSGTSAELVPMLRQRASLIAAFYTRCMNPAKCSLTVTRLAAFAHYAQCKPPGRELNVFALSYDSAHDRPDRLFAYGRARGFPFSERARMIRCRSGWNALRAQLSLRVGYGEATVNDHARELFLVLPNLQAMALDVEKLSDCKGLMNWIAQATEAS